jgi:hypothetical protein
MTIDVYDVVHYVTQLMETYKRDAGFTELGSYDSFAKPGDFLEITGWYNNEGFDVHLSTQAECHLRGVSTRLFTLCLTIFLEK